MRAQAGQPVTLFDGRGREAAATIDSVSRREVRVAVETWREIPRMPRIDLTMAVAMPKPERCKGLIERLTEIGVHTLIPVVAERSQRLPSESLLQKWRRIVIESCKQSGRNQLMPILSPMSLPDLLAMNLNVADDAHAGRLQNVDDRRIAHVTTGNVGTEKLPNTQHLASDAVIIAIGPEGGWTTPEVASATAAGWHSFSLGERIYRIETAAIVCASLAIHHVCDA